MTLRKTGIVFFPAFDWAISETHPEREERLLYTRDQIFEEGLMDLPGIVEYKPRMATAHEIARAHICVPTVNEQTTEAHLFAAGGALVIADAVMHKEVDNGFALVRPPGHHAMRIVHGNRGFCNINNEAVMVEYLRHKYGVKRIAIVDTDVHHGDGTQDIYYHDPDVLFISFHQDGRTLYPGTGFTNELGGPNAFGYTINLPLLPETSDEDLHYLIDHLVLPIIEDFQPEILINSAGQDNHYTDPLANMCISAQGYGLLNEKLKPDIAVLEGGYAIETALPYVNTAIILAMAGLDYSHVYEPDYESAKAKRYSPNFSYLQELKEKMWALWKNKNCVDIAKVFGTGEYYQREKGIFYDTSNIRERQVERVRICQRCSGYLTLTSQAKHIHGLTSSIFAVVIPHHACSRCLSLGKEEYERAKTNANYEHIYYQDHYNDCIKHFARNKGEETL